MRTIKIGSLAVQLNSRAELDTSSIIASKYFFQLMYFLHAKFIEEVADNPGFVNKSPETLIGITGMSALTLVAP